ncbi:MAG: hypothetical protein H6720_12500 [Sandaracinus sp.]|nr:hypothetical protein [Sandaracinus sp.]
MPQTKPEFLSRPGRASRAQQVLPGQVVFATRRVLGRRFLLIPDRELVWLVKYLLAVCAKRHGIELHEVAVMSSHLHLLFTDWLGRRGLFFNEFHAMLAKCVQRIRGWTLPVFDKRQTNQPVVVTVLGAVEAAAYIQANAVMAGLVASPPEWPGNLTDLRETGWGKRERVARPDVLHREDGVVVRCFDAKNPNWPKDLELELVPLAARLGMAPEECVAQVKAQRDALVEEARAEVAKRGGRFLGRLRAMRRRSTRAQATSTEEANEVVPRIKAGRGQGERAAMRSRTTRRSVGTWPSAACGCCRVRRTWCFPRGASCGLDSSGSRGTRVSLRPSFDAPRGLERTNAA